MSTDVKLLPMPEGEAIGWSQAWSHDQMRDYARANMEPLIEQLSDTEQALAAQTELVKHYKAENERLHAGRDGYIAQHARDSRELRAVCAERDKLRESWRVRVIERGNEIRLHERAEARAERLAEAMRELSEGCRAAIKAGDWKVDGACDPDSLLSRIDAAIDQPRGKGGAGK